MTNKYERRSYQELDATALGVEKNLDQCWEFSQIIVLRTIEIARQIGISESNIQRWATERRRVIENMSNKINEYTKYTPTTILKSSD